MSSFWKKLPPGWRVWDDDEEDGDGERRKEEDDGGGGGGGDEGGGGGDDGGGGDGDGDSGEDSGGGDSGFIDEGGGGGDGEGDGGFSESFYSGGEESFDYRPAREEDDFRSDRSFKTRKDDNDRDGDPDGDDTPDTPNEIGDDIERDRRERAARWAEEERVAREKKQQADIAAAQAEVEQQAALGQLANLGEGLTPAEQIVKADMAAEGEQLPSPPSIFRPPTEAPAEATVQAPQAPTPDAPQGSTGNITLVGVGPNNQGVEIHVTAAEYARLDEANRSLWRVSDTQRRPTEAAAGSAPAPDNTQPPKASVPQPVNTQTAPAPVTTGDGQRAADGQTLTQQSGWTQAMFRGEYKGNAEAEWVRQHNAELERNQRLYGSREPKAGTPGLPGTNAPPAPDRRIGVTGAPGPGESGRYGINWRDEAIARPAAPTGSVNVDSPSVLPGTRYMQQENPGLRPSVVRATTGTTTALINELVKPPPPKPLLPPPPPIGTGTDVVPPLYSPPKEQEGPLGIDPNQQPYQDESRSAAPSFPDIIPEERNRPPEADTVPNIPDPDAGPHELSPPGRYVYGEELAPRPAERPASLPSPSGQPAAMPTTPETSTAPGLDLPAILVNPDGTPVPTLDQIPQALVPATDDDVNALFFGEAAKDLNIPYPRQDQLAVAEKWSVCGPVAAMAFAASQGIEISYEQALNAARKAGWTPQGGMVGPASQVAAMRSLGIDSELGPVDLGRIRSEIDAGHPVLLSSPGTQGHYFVVSGVDDDGRLNLGNSALALAAAGGRTQFTLPEMRSQLGSYGRVDTAIYIHNPPANGPVWANQPQTQRSGSTQPIPEASPAPQPSALSAPELGPLPTSPVEGAQYTVDRALENLDTTTPVDTIVQLAGVARGQSPEEIADASRQLSEGLAQLYSGDAKGKWTEPYLNDIARLAWAREERTNGRLSDPRTTPSEYIEKWKDAFYGGDRSVALVGELHNQTARSTAYNPATARRSNLTATQAANPIPAPASTSSSPSGATEATTQPTTTRVSTTTPTLPPQLRSGTVQPGLQSGPQANPADQMATVWQRAYDQTGDENYAHGLTALLVGEGGMRGGIGDKGQSSGPFQFYWGGGEGNNFQTWLSQREGRQVSQAEAMQRAKNLDEVLEYYIPKSKAFYDAGQARGLANPVLAIVGGGHNRGAIGGPEQRIYEDAWRRYQSGQFEGGSTIQGVSQKTIAGRDDVPLTTEDSLPPWEQAQYMYREPVSDLPGDNPPPQTQSMGATADPRMQIRMAGQSALPWYETTDPEAGVWTGESPLENVAARVWSNAYEMSGGDSEFATLLGGLTNGEGGYGGKRDEFGAQGIFQFDPRYAEGKEFRKWLDANGYQSVPTEKAARNVDLAMAYYAPFIKDAYDNAKARGVQDELGLLRAMVEDPSRRGYGHNSGAWARPNLRANYVQALQEFKQGIFRGRQ